MVILFSSPAVESVCISGNHYSENTRWTKKDSR